MPFCHEAFGPVLETGLYALMIHIRHEHRGAGRPDLPRKCSQRWRGPRP